LHDRRQYLPLSLGIHAGCVPVRDIQGVVAAGLIYGVGAVRGY
jgi:hypothetical protein